MNVTNTDRNNLEDNKAEQPECSGCKTSTLGSELEGQDLRTICLKISVNILQVLIS